ncbi:hypothetical protein [Ottowia sp. oral taxon 894]|uniref:hypothetical protein n=1 Tax=Ottowia sp. oral taxon 894 TaxID=1658672 RepID=UPI0012E1666A|nr:hypothetical protein [Ottowia sp. oral taxon 894]
MTNQMRHERLKQWLPRISESFVARMTLAALIDELASLPLRIRHSLSPDNGFTRLAARH